MTVEVAPDGVGTRITHADQYAFIAWTGDGRAEAAERGGGTRLLLDRLTFVVERTAQDG